MKDLNSLFEIFKSAYEPTEVELQPMGTEDIKKIMQDVLNHMSYPTAMENIAKVDIDYVIQNSKGNPFRCKELTKGMLLQMSEVGHDRGGKAAEGGRAGSTSGSSAGGNESSKSIRDAIGSSIQARFDKLPSNLKAILKTASVIGKTFSHDELAQILPRSFT